MTRFKFHSSGENDKKETADLNRDCNRDSGTDSTGHAATTDTEASTVCTEETDDEVHVSVSSNPVHPSVSLLREDLDRLTQSVPNESAANDAGPERSRFELLLLHALQETGGDYAFVISPAGSGGYAEQFVKLSAVVERDKQGRLQACYDSLAHRRPDPTLLSVMRLGRGIRGRPIDIGLPGCLPGSHPVIRYYMMVPIETGHETTSVLFLANPLKLEAGVSEESLMQCVEALVNVMARGLRHESLTPESSLSTGIHDVGARHYIQLMNASINAVVIVSPTGQITAFNPAAERLFGRGSSDATGLSFERYIPAEFLMPILKRANYFDSPAGASDVIPVNQRPVLAHVESGCTVDLSCSAYYSRVDGTVYTTFVFEHNNQSRELSGIISGQQQFEALTNVAPVGIVRLSAEWTCDYANDMWCRLSGLTMDETLGEGWVDALHAEDVVETLVELREALSENRIFSTNMRLQSPTGETAWVTLSATTTLSDSGHFNGCLLVLLDVTEAHEASERLRFAASHDVLTQLANRSAFLDHLQNCLNDRVLRASTALLYLDLDGFKSINDTLGHDCGDELLRQVARRLERFTRAGDLCARLGGDEFVLVITSANGSEAVQQLAERIVRNFHATFDVFGNELYLSTSIGIAYADQDTASSDHFIKQADAALYKAKSSGRSRWMVYTREFHVEDLQRSSLRSRIRRAVEQQEFSLVYQPQFCINEQRITGMEALLRWHPTDCEVPDTEHLVSVLEETGLINDVGQWVLQEACAQYESWRQKGLLDPDISMSVNVSAAQLSLANFPARLDAILKLYQMSPECLTLEITESSLLEKSKSSMRVISDLKALGIKLSLDDFGTGYASLSYLTRLPVDCLKIDKSFVLAMRSDEPSQTIVMSVLAMAGTLNIDVVAEGIEDDATLHALQDMQCRYGQGYWFSKPLPASAIEPLLIKDTYHESQVLLLD